MNVPGQVITLVKEAPDPVEPKQAPSTLVPGFEFASDVNSVRKYNQELEDEE